MKLTSNCQLWGDEDMNSVLEKCSLFPSLTLCIWDRFYSCPIENDKWENTKTA